jgi:sucrose-6-phosphate hydrolase SacC (GH32 family)
MPPPWLFSAALPGLLADFAAPHALTARVAGRPPGGGAGSRQRRAPGWEEEEPRPQPEGFSQPPLPPSPPRNMSDPFYTAFHFQPLKNWMNDPCGPFFDEETKLYHIFTQYNPTGPRWGDMSWYHAVSNDLLHWTHLPVALTADHSYDCGGEFSGSATLVPAGSGGGAQTPVLSVSVACDKWVLLAVPAASSRGADPLIQNWTKSGVIPFSGSRFDGPVFDAPAYSTGGFRDPSTAWKGSDGVWRMAAGCGDNKNGGPCLFKSDNFVNWTSVGWLHHFESPTNTPFWECPDFFPLSDPADPDGDPQWVLKASSQGKDWWSLGHYTEVSGEAPDVFLPTSYEAHDGPQQGLGRQLLDFGNLYASKSFWDPAKKRQVMWGWVQEEGDIPHQGEDWSSLQSIPRVITIDPANNSRLTFNPISEVDSLRRHQTSATQPALKAGSRVLIHGAGGKQLDIVAAFKGDFSRAGLQFGVEVLRPAAGGDGDGTDSGCTATVTVLPHNQSKISGPALGQVSVSGGGSGPFLMSDQSLRDSDGVITVRVLVDRSIVEVFVHGGRGVVTHRVYPTTADSAVSLVRTDSISDVTMSAHVDVYAMAVADPPDAAALVAFAQAHMAL